MLVTKELMEMCKKNYELREPCTSCRHNKSLCPKIKYLSEGMTPYDIGLKEGVKDYYIKEGK